MIKKIGGFTLVEVLIALSIVVILAAIAIASFSSQIFKGKDAIRKSDLDRIKIALEEYEKDHNCYPLDDLAGTCTPGTGLVPYLNKIPCDPTTQAAYYYQHEDSVCPGWFRVYTKLENTADALAMPWCGGPNNNSFNYYVSSPNLPYCNGGGSGSGGASIPVGTPAPSAGPTSPPTGFYGCQGGVCVAVGWDFSRPGPACDPNFPSANCYGRCGPPENECHPWR